MEVVELEFRVKGKAQEIVVNKCGENKRNKSQEIYTIIYRHLTLLRLWDKFNIVCELIRKQNFIFTNRMPKVKH